MRTYQSYSSGETKRFGRELAKALVRGKKQRPERKRATIFALKGELGAGKTTFVQGFLRGLGVKKRSASPTFIIMRRHGVRAKRFTNIFHIDAYRLKKQKELKHLEFDAVLRDPQNIVLIEWAERVKKILPRGTKWIRFRHGKTGNERTIRH